MLRWPGLEGSLMEYYIIFPRHPYGHTSKNILSNLGSCGVCDRWTIAEGVNKAKEFPLLSFSSAENPININLYTRIPYIYIYIYMSITITIQYTLYTYIYMYMHHITTPPKYLLYVQVCLGWPYLLGGPRNQELWNVQGDTLCMSIHQDVCHHPWERRGS